MFTVNDLPHIPDRIRKTLTTQLNMVQGELEPKQKELTKATDKLQEMNREYEISLHAITEKEKSLGQKAENLVALQKQVRELRTNTAQKEATLRRAAMSLEEFVYAMNEARFAPFQKNEHGRFIIPNKDNSKCLSVVMSFSCA
jgi:septal ring factor EnvC (AmiA/AmiB activator)